MIGGPPRSTLFPYTTLFRFNDTATTEIGSSLGKECRSRWSPYHFLDLGVPVLGICYGFQVMAQQLGGEVANTGLREYGSTAVHLAAGSSTLLGDQPSEQTTWMSHGDSVSKA